MSSVKDDAGARPLTAGDALVRVLEAEGVEWVFGVPGSHILPFYDALSRARRIRTVLAKHEEGAGYMARAHALVTGRPAVVVGTAGPGAFNLLPALADARCEDAPVLAITGQVSTTVWGRGGLQECTGMAGGPDQDAALARVTKSSALAFAPELVARLAREAFRVMLTPPYGPAHLSVPPDVMAAEVAFEELPPERYRVVGSRPVDAAAITRLAAAIARAERPALLVGRRARFPDAGAAVRALVERFRIPVCTSLAAKGLVAEDTLLSLGILAVFGHRTSEKYLKECDLIVTIGESLEELTSVYFDPDIFARPLVQVDHDPLRIGRAFPIADAVVGDIGATLEGLAGALVEMGCRPRCDANELGAFKEAHQHFAEAVTASEAVPLKPQRVCAELARALPPDVVVVADVSTIALWAARYLPARPGSFLHFDGIGAMGGATAGAVGVKLAAGARPVVCLTGDGCFQMHGMELATAVGAGAPVIYVVMNDGHLNLVRFAQIVAYGERCISVDMANPDFAALGRAFGVQGHRVERPGELEALLPRLIAAGESAIVDVAYDGDEVPPFKPRTLLMNKQMGLPLTSTRMAGRAFRKILDER